MRGMDNPHDGDRGGHAHDLNPEQMRRVEEIRKALVEEMSSGSGSKRRAITDIQELKQDALSAIQHTMKHSTNEALKIKVSTWAMDRILDAEKIGDSDLVGFLNEMAGVSDANNP